MNRSLLRRQGKGASYPGLEIIAKLATVLRPSPADLLTNPPLNPAAVMSVSARAKG
jgi:hypothetical protein